MQLFLYTKNVFFNWITSTGNLLGYKGGDTLKVSPPFNTSNLSSKSICIFITLLIIGSSTTLSAQYPSDYKEEIKKNQQQKKTEPEVDTLSPDVYYFYLDNPAQTTLWEEKDFNNFHIFDPIRQQSYDHNHLGNLGSAAKSVFYQPRFHKGFDIGFSNFDIYKISKEDIRFYQLEKVYSDISFSQGASQEQTNFAGKFSKNVSQQVNLAIDYKRINNRGQYNNQVNKNTSFSMNGWYHAPSGNYQAYASYTTNTVQQLENGGVNTQDTTLTTEIISIARPINTENAEARYFQRELNYSHYYRLGKKDKPVSKPTQKALKQAPITNKNTKKDTTKSTVNIQEDSTKSTVNILTAIPKTPPPIPSRVRQKRSLRDRQYTLFHQFILRRNTLKFSDAGNNTSPNFYENFLIDDRGVRHFMDVRQYENTFSIRTFRLQKNTLSYAQPDDKTSTTKDLIEAGITHNFTDISRRTADSTAQNLFLFGNIQYTPSERLKILAYAHLGVVGQRDDYYLKGDFLWDLPKIGKLELGIIAQRYTPSLLQQELIVTQQKIWNNNFNKTFENSLFASYYIPLLNLKIKGQLHTLNNYIFFNEQAFPQQTDSETTITITQFVVDHQLNWKDIQLENTVYYQNTSQQYLRLPEWYSIHRLSFTNTLFKKTLEYQIGAQLRIHTPYLADRFQPLIGQFYLQNQAFNTSYPNMDAFLNIRIADFRFFINAQNIGDYFRTDFYYPYYQYPLFDATIRFGFRWVFLD